MSIVREHSRSYFMLGVYTIVGAIIRFFITYPCGSFFEDVHNFVTLYAIAFIVITIFINLLRFALPNRFRNRVVIGIVTGFMVGFGGTTAVFLVLKPCV